MFSNYILQTRYFDDGETSFEEVAARVAKAIAGNTNEYDEFYKLMIERKFVPAGRTLAYAGTKKKLNPNCVVLDVQDSMEGIYDTLRRATVLQKHGCGLGFNFSNLRPAGYSCKSSGDIASGPLSYMSVYSHSFKIVQQHGRSGANIGILSVEHPDIIGFIHMKDDLTKFTNFNMSVLITERFMKQLLERPDDKWMCRFGDVDVKPRLISYNDEFVYNDITDLDMTAKDLWNEIVHAAWCTGEPGLLFEDNINRTNRLCAILGNIKSANPCGEISMYENECCNLGSINLEEFCDEVPQFDLPFDVIINKYVKSNELGRTAYMATLFLDNVIDRLNIPDERLKNNVRLLRRIGLGIMGLADMLIKLRVPYDSELGRSIAVYVLKVIRSNAEKASWVLTFDNDSVYDRLKANGTDNLNNLDINGEHYHYLITHANTALMAIAPNGSTSMIHGVSSGIEPYFSLAYRRTLKGNLQNEVIMNKHLIKLLKHENLFRDDVIDRIVTDNSLINVTELDPRYVSVYKTAQTISPEAHVLMLTEAQKIVDNSISKTCNLDHSATESETSDIMLMAHKLGAKGITIYRDKSRESQVFQLVKDKCKDGNCDI